MATVTQFPLARNAASTAAAVAWHTLLKAADKEACRDDLEAGSSHDLQLRITGEIDGAHFDQSLSAILTVGHDSESASSQTPDAAGLIAWLLGQMAPAHRDCVLREAVSKFEAAGGEWPGVDKGIREASDLMLKKARAIKRVNKRGAVSCKHSLSAGAKSRPRFAVVG